MKNNAPTDTFHFLGHIIRLRDSEGNAAGLTEWRTRPGDSSPAIRHRQDREWIYVAAGRYRFDFPGETQVYDKDKLLRVPDGVMHRFTNIGLNAGMLCVMTSPGAPFHRLMLAAADALPSGSTEFPEHSQAVNANFIIDTARALGMELLLSKSNESLPHPRAQSR